MNFYTAHDVVFLTSAVLAQWRGVPPYKESSAWSWFGSALRISSTQLTDEHEIKTRILNRQTTSREPVKKENQRSCSHFQCSLVSCSKTQTHNRPILLIYRHKNNSLFLPLTPSRCISWRCGWGNLYRQWCHTWPHLLTGPWQPPLGLYGRPHGAASLRSCWVRPHQSITASKGPGWWEKGENENSRKSGEREKSF